MTLKDLRKAAAETTQAAAERGAELIEEAIARIQPLVETAGEKVGPLAQEAAARTAEFAHEAKVRSADIAARTFDQLEPKLQDALDKVTPAVDAARTKVQADLLPKLSELLHDAAEHPAVQAVVEAPAELVPAKKKKSKFKKFAKFVAVSAILAGAVAAVRQFLGTKDDGWTAHEPSKAYVNSTDTFASVQQEQAETEAAVEEMIEEGAPLTPQDMPAPAAATEYGEGSYVGEEPPPGFIIKGNERSMKFHLPGTGGFERTIPDVWFNSEEAAEAAGFTKAQR